MVLKWSKKRNRFRMRLRSSKRSLRMVAQLRDMPVSTKKILSLMFLSRLVVQPRDRANVTAIANLPDFFKKPVRKTSSMDRWCFKRWVLTSRVTLLQKWAKILLALKIWPLKDFRRNAKLDSSCFSINSRVSVKSITFSMCYLIRIQQTLLRAINARNSL